MGFEGNGGSAFGARVRARRNELGLTLTEVAQRVGCRESYLSMIETGRRPPPCEELLVALEQVLLLEGGQLVENARWLATPASVRKQVEELQDRDRRAGALIEQLRRGPRDLDAMLKSGELQRLVESHVSNIEGLGVAGNQIPVINKVAAGYPRDFTDMGYPARVADEYLACPDVMVAEDSQAFAARVVGDSMEPSYHEGDTVVFSPDAPTPAGSDCFVRLEPDGETTFKRVFFEGDEGDEFVRLEPLNEAYQVRRVHREEIAGMYAAVYVMRPVRG
ncbi:MAG: helix-turn-helix domain-containing protein [Planctomycetes bacterium]|nr:helix-turn-helix domain-containing protein [Planctomycetota bacterium]